MCNLVSDDVEFLFKSFNISFLDNISKQYCFIVLFIVHDSMHYKIRLDQRFGFKLDDYISSIPGHNPWFHF